jgi:glycosyltransferase involved in cell wall biosynthesis
MKVLFLQKRVLFPINDGGKVRTGNIVRHLARWHDVTYLCNTQASDEPYLESMEALGVRLVAVPWRETPRGSLLFYWDLARNLASKYPFNVSKDYDPLLRGRAVEFLQNESFDLVICDFVQMARNAIGLPGPPRVLFEHNVEAEIFKRHATTGPGWLRRRYMAIQYRKMRRFEAEAGRDFAAVVAVSERDKTIFEQEYGWNHVHAIDTAVDLEYYRPADAPEQPDRIVFVGSLDWLPNSDGVQFFVREVWPRIRAARPGATFQIVGRNPNASVRRLQEVDGVTVAGSVPDTRPYLADASVVVVPLLVGGGTRLKIFEAMAMRKAVVSTSLGAEGLKITPGVHFEVADSPEALADRIIHLLGDDEARKNMAQAAYDHVCWNFSSEAVARQFEAVCLSAAESGREAKERVTAGLTSGS